jgi:hypothetical protein
MAVIVDNDSNVDKTGLYILLGSLIVLTFILILWCCLSSCLGEYFLRWLGCENCCKNPYRRRKYYDEEEDAEDYELLE